METVDGATTSYAYNELDQLLTAGGTSFAYDPRGNLTQATDGADVTAYSWDARDRLGGVGLPDGTTVVYSYNADGRRVAQGIDGTMTHHLWDETSPYGDVGATRISARNLAASPAWHGPCITAS